MKTPQTGHLRKAGLILAGAFITASAAWAVPPNKVEFAFDTVGFVVGTCGAFEVWTDFHGDGFAIEHFDQDGNFASVNVHTNFTESIYYNSENPAIFIVGGPGEVENLRFDLTSDPPEVASSGLIFKVTVPGHGVIFHEGGRIIFNNITGDVLFQSGPKDFQEQDVAALCAALAG